MRRSRVLATLTAAAALAVVQPAPAAAQSFFGTGAGVVGTGQDPHWTVAAQHGGFNDGLAGFGGTFLPAYVFSNYGSLPFISNNPQGSNGGVGSYMYFIFRQTFDLSGYNASSTALSFQWGCDDVPYNPYNGDHPVGWTPQFSLNGGALQGGGSCGPYGFGSVVNLNSGFVSGLNTIDFYVQGNGQTDGMGLGNVAFSADPQSVVPEPASMALVGTGLLGVLGLARRRRR